MKKICILTSVHSAFDVRIFHKEAKTLVNAGYDVTLIAPQESHDTNKNADKSKNNYVDFVDGVKIIYLSKAKNRFCRILFLTRKVYKLALEQKADIYHFHDPELLPWMLKLKKKTKAKVIYDVHEDYAKGFLSKEWLPKVFRKLISLSFGYYERLVSQKFDYIITATPSIENFFQRRKVINVRNFPIVENFLSPALSLKNKLGGKYFSVIYVGGISKINGITQTIQALEYLNPDFEVGIKLIGKFLPPAYQREISKLKGSEKVDYLGWIMLERIPLHLAQANAGIICASPEPNSLESEPNKLFEYMLAGLPVIASNFPLWEEFIKGNDCGICVNPLDPREIAKAIEYLIEHPDEVRKMGENGRKAVLEKYNWENEGKKLLKVYEKLIKS